MMLNSARAIDRFAVALTLYQTQPATYVDHKPVTPAPIEVAIRGVVQPGQDVRAAKGNGLTDELEGTRIEASWLLWTRATVAEDDVIKDAAGIRYRIMWLWPRAEGGFFRAALERLK